MIKSIFSQMIHLLKEKKIWIVSPILIFIILVALFAYLSEKSISLPLLYQIF